MGHHNRSLVTDKLNGAYDDDGGGGDDGQQPLTTGELFDLLH